MENKERILVVEDEKSITNFISTILATNGFDTLTAETGTQALMLTASHNPDAMILDLGLPDIDGQKIIKSVREWSDVPIIVVSARSHERDKVTALDLGADDYMTKPFSTGELLARLRAALRHASQRRAAQNDAAQAAAYRYDGLCVDYGKHRVFLDGVDIHLTQIEYRILELLTRHAGRVLTYDYIIKSVWGASASFDKQILRVNMANIRRKLESNPAAPKYLKTEIGVGYWIKEEE